MPLQHNSLASPVIRHAAVSCEICHRLQVAILNWDKMLVTPAEWCHMVPIPPISPMCSIAQSPASVYNFRVHGYPLMCSKNLGLTMTSHVDWLSSKTCHNFFALSLTFLLPFSRPRWLQAWRVLLIVFHIISFLASSIATVLPTWVKDHPMPRFSSKQSSFKISTSQDGKKNSSSSLLL